MGGRVRTLAPNTAATRDGIDAPQPVDSIASLAGTVLAVELRADDGHLGYASGAAKQVMSKPQSTPDHKGHLRLIVEVTLGFA